jgi:hypothetical protein
VSRRLWLAALVVAAMGMLAVAASGQRGAAFTVPVKDREGDGGRGIDLVRATFGRDDEGRLVATMRASKRFAAGRLRDGDGVAQGSLCLRLYTKRDDEAEVPDYLVCATPRARGSAFTGRVLREQANGLPQTVANAAVTRPNRRTIQLRFGQRAIGRPERVRFAAEALRYAPRCPAPLGCRDSVPDAPSVISIRLR